MNIVPTPSKTPEECCYPYEEIRIRAHEVSSREIRKMKTDRDVELLEVDAVPIFYDPLKFIDFFGNVGEWFNRMEETFAKIGLKDETLRCREIIIHLPPGIFTLCEKTFDDVKITGSYDKLKNEVLLRTREWDEKKAKRIFRHEFLGQRKPSELLRSMQQLVRGTKIDKTLFRRSFLEKLPSYVLNVFGEGADTVEPSVLANLADKIVRLRASNGKGSTSCHFPCAIPRNILKCSTFAVLDRTTGQKFIVDSGADLSLIPPQDFHKKCEDRENTLCCANGVKLSTYGEVVMQLDLGLERKFEWTFRIADSSSCLIGSDFLNGFQFIADCATASLIWKWRNVVVQGEHLR